jgi:heptosyltransferase-2
MSEKVLIIQTGFLGDAVLATSLFKSLKQLDIEIGFLIKSQFSEVFKNHSAISMLHLIDKNDKNSNRKLIEELKKNNYNKAIIPHRSFRSSYLAFASKIPIRSGFRQSAGNLLLNNKVEYNLYIHEILRNNLLFEKLYGKNIISNNSLKIWLEADKSVLKNLEISIDNKPIICVAPGSVWETKRWHVNGFIETVNKLIERGYYVCLIGSPQEQDICRLINSNIKKNNSEYCKNFAGKISLRETIALISISERLLTNDSAPLHIAEGLGIPCTSIFGATVPEFGFAPISPNSNVVQIENLKCRPCSIHGNHKCPINTFNCMIDINSEMVLNNIFHK